MVSTPREREERGRQNRIDPRRRCDVDRPVGTLASPSERHWMRAGPEGAIVTEYASHHDHDGLRFSHPDGKFFTVDLDE